MILDFVHHQCPARTMLQMLRFRVYCTSQLHKRIIIEDVFRMLASCLHDIVVMLRCEGVLGGRMIVLQGAQHFQRPVRGLVTSSAVLPA